MAYRQQNFDVVYGIVVGGDADDPDPSQSGGFRVWIPGQYGPNVKREDLPFARGLAQATQEGVTRFNPPPERGTGVCLMKRTGESGTGELICIGTVAGEIGGGQATPGNSFLPTVLQEWDKANKHDKKTPRAKPKGLKEVIDNGALVKEAVEAGKNWKNEMHFGMLNSTALPSILAMFMDNKTGIPTAKAPYSSIPSADMLSGLGGSFLNLGDMFNKIPDSTKSQIYDKLDDSVALTLNNMIELLQYTEPSSETGDIAGVRINEEVFIANMAQLFLDRDIKSIADIVQLFIDLLTDPSLLGCDLLDDIVSVVETAYGNTNIKITGCGTKVEIEESEESKSAASALSSLMSSASSFPSAMPGENFFGGSSQSMQEMIGRLTPEQMKIATEQLQKHVAPGTDPRKKNNEYLISQFFNGYIMG